MKKKKEILTPTKNRQIELLKKYYEVDEEKRVVKITLAYEKASELFVTDYSSEEHPEFKSEILSRVSEIISRVPIEYKVELSFAIDDYEGYDPDKLLESFNDLVELNHYEVVNEGKKKSLKVALLLVAGIICLIFMIAGNHNGWFGEDPYKDLISEIVDIVGWVFIWEAVSMLFLSPSEERLRTVKLRARVSSVSFKDGNTNEIKSEEKCEEIFESWVGESKTKKASKDLLLISGSGFLAVAASTLISGVSDIWNNANSYSPLFLTLYAIFVLISVSFMVISGIGAISSYLGKGPFRKAVGGFAIANIAIGIIGIVFSFIDMDGTAISNWKMIVSGISSIILFLLYGAGWLMSLKKK